MCREREREDGCFFYRRISTSYSISRVIVKTRRLTYSHFTFVTFYFAFSSTSCFCYITFYTAKAPRVPPHNCLCISSIWKCTRYFLNSSPWINSRLVEHCREGLVLEKPVCRLSCSEPGRGGPLGLPASSPSEPCRQLPSLLMPRVTVENSEAGLLLSLCTRSANSNPLFPEV